MATNKVWLVLLAVIAAAGILSVPGASSAADKKPVAQPLRQNSVFDETVTMGPTNYKGGEPGENELYPRGYDGAPPQVPHDVSGFATTREGNDCINCHEKENGMENTPYMPVTHYTDGKFSQARFQCDLCHVPQADVTPLVKNGNDKFIVTKKKQ